MLEITKNIRVGTAGLPRSTDHYSLTHTLATDAISPALNYLNDPVGIFNKYGHRSFALFTTYNGQQK